jgi:hypothetical protein
MAGGELLWILAAHLVLTGLPGVAAALLAARRGVGSVPVLLALALATSGIVAMLSFWAFYATPVLGESFAYFTIFGSIGLTLWALRGRRLDSRLLHELATPLGLWAFGSAFLVFFGFLHGGANDPLSMSASRFSTHLPGDNAIPYFYAEWFFHNGHHGGAPIFPGGWLSSDRPPLQVGYVLGQTPFGWGSTALHYEVLGVVLQQLWIIGLWALLVAARVGRVTRALAIAAVLISGVAIVNGFFVWPKMLPAAMLLAAAALMVTPLWFGLRRNLWVAALLAALFGLAMLGHGSSVFGIIPLALIAAYRGLPSWRWMGVGLLVGFALMAPWSAYQKYAEPPGNRLTKWMLAGVVEVDDRGVPETIFDSYREAGFGGAIHDKAENFITMAGGGPALEGVESAVGDIGSGDLREAVREVRAVLFYCLLPSFGLLLIAPFVMVVARRRGRRNPSEWRFALTCLAVLVIGAISWGLLLFGNLPARTVMHAGSFALPLLGICGAIAGLRATFPRFAIYVVVISILLTLALYTPSLEPLPGSSYSALAALAAAIALAGFFSLALRSDVNDG